MSEPHDLIAARRDKLRRIRERGLDPYPRSFPYSHRLAAIHAGFSGVREGESEETVAVCGRLVSLRHHGKTVFAHLEDATGRLQLYLRSDQLGPDLFNLLEDVDLGDHLGATGRIMRTRTGELTVKAERVTVLSKAIRPPPEKWHGLKDVDIRYRQRHVDLSSNAQVREIFRTRTRVLNLLRRHLDARGYLEVETPVLQPLYGGADATPFTTRYESLDTTYYLRISNELYLKRLLAGGLDRVYEFSRDFRNEGIDRMHTPEFTILEFYEAYTDYLGMMSLVEDMIAAVVAELKGGTSLTYQGKTLEFGAAWPRIPFVPTLARELDYDPLEAGIDRLRDSAARAGIRGAEGYSRPKLLDKLFGALVQDRLDGPAFVTDHPLALSPLAKAHRDDPRLAERFELVVAGMEVGNAFSELNDPDEQRRRFEEQRELRRQGDREAHEPDLDFVAALEHGMPPAGGVGIGIDRLVMLLVDAGTIREVILFPQLNPEAPSG